MAQLIGAPSAQIDAGAEPAGFAIAGSQRGWSTAQPGRLIELILRTCTGSPVFVVDEIDKAGAASSDQGISYALSTTLLSLLEPMSAGSWTCPYFRVRFDLRWVSWVLTSNNLEPLPAPLLSRCHVLELAALRAGPGFLSCCRFGGHRVKLA